MREIEIRAGALGNGAAVRVAGRHCMMMPSVPHAPLARTPPAPHGPLAPHDPGAPHHLPDARDLPGDAPPEQLVRAGHLAATGWGGARLLHGLWRVASHHLLLPRHALVCAEGLWLESL